MGRRWCANPHTPKQNVLIDNTSILPHYNHMRPVTPETLNELRSKISLSALISETHMLQRAGREWKGLCPFHDEKTASFTVNDEKGFYHCFGCGAHGDAIKWLTETRSLDFRAAVLLVASKAGIRLTFEQAPSETARKPENRKGGAKLSRSETVTVRLDPKLNYLCELAARAQRRTKSSFIEWAVAESLATVEIPDMVSFDFTSGEESSVSIQQKSQVLWHVDEPDRLVALAMHAPSLLNHEEQLIWRNIKENGFIWKGKYNSQGDWTWVVDDDNLIRDRLRDHWEVFKAVSLGEEEAASLPSWQRRKSFEDDIPF